MAWLDLRGPIVADTVYCDGKLVAKDVSATLPPISFVTADYKAMGTMSLPIRGLLEAMELSITKIGIDLGLADLIQLESKTLEFRWVQDVVNAEGTTKPEGCKAFVKVVPKGLPGIGLEIGAAPESDLTFACTRYQMYVAGAELFCVDRLSKILRIKNKDYYSAIASLL